MLNIRKAFCLGFIVALCSFNAIAQAESYPVLYAREGLIDEASWIEKIWINDAEREAARNARHVLAPDGGKPVRIDGIEERVVIYTVEGDRVSINNLSSTVIYTDLDVVDRHEKLLSSYEGKTPIGETFLINEQKSDINIDVDNFANGKAETLGFDISDHWISSMQIITTYADGVTTEGYAIYALIRNGLPVETTPYFSKRSIQERRISGEYMRVDWTESGIVSFTIRMLTIENKEESSGTLLSQTEAEALVQDQVEQLSSLLGCGVEVSLCYIVVPERGGMTYYALVPAWRFSFQGKGIEDANAVCVHAYTGEVIR